MHGQKNIKLYFLKTHFNIILLYTPILVTPFLSLKYRQETLYEFTFSPTRATRPTHFILLDLINRIIFYADYESWSRSHWPRGLRRRSAVARLLGLCVWIPPVTWMFVYCECYVLSGRGLCDGLVTRPEESYRLCCVVVCDLETSRIGASYIWH